MIYGSVPEWDCLHSSPFPGTGIYLQCYICDPPRIHRDIASRSYAYGSLNVKAATRQIALADWPGLSLDQRALVLRANRALFLHAGDGTSVGLATCRTG